MQGRVIFSAGWVVTSGSAEARANEVAHEAVIAHLAPIAVAQFMQDPNRMERFTELKEMDSWKRAEYVQEKGWVTMPGSKSPNDEIKYAVVDRIMKLNM